MSTNKSIAASATLIGFATLCSRILGFIRDITIARLFGVAAIAQAFVVAFKIPNLLRDLVGEGAAGAAFVPVFSEYKARHSEREFWELVTVVLVLLVVMLAALVLGGIVFSPLIVRLIAPGFVAEPHTLQLAVTLNRIIFPYLLLISLTSFAASILNTFKHFSVPAFAPCLLNAAIIVFALVFGENVMGLALGVLVGGVLQLVVQLPPLYKRGFRLLPVKSLYHPEAARIGRLLLPRLFSSAVYQLNNFVDSIFGSLSIVVGTGGVAALYFSYRLIQFPLGVFTNALSQALLPALSEQALEEGHARLSDTLSFGLRATFLVMLPASVGLMIMAHPLIGLLFQGGRFGAYATTITAQALLYYSIGLSAYGGSKIVQSCFFALKDTATPAKVAALGLALNIVLNTALMFPMKLGGLALATSLSGIVTFLILLRLLKRRIASFDTRGIVSSCWRIALSCAAMGAVVFFSSRAAGLAHPSSIIRILSLGAILIAGAACYILFCFIFGVREMRELLQWVRRRKNARE